MIGLPWYSQMLRQIILCRTSLERTSLLFVGADYKITPTLNVRQAYASSPSGSNPLLYLTESISYSSSNNLIAFFHMPIVSSSFNGTVYNSVSGSALTNEGTNKSGHFFSADSYTDQSVIPSASIDTPFSLADDHADPYGHIDHTVRKRPNYVRSMCF